jgi:hypothetical protein
LCHSNTSAAANVHCCLLLLAVLHAWRALTGCAQVLLTHLPWHSSSALLAAASDKSGHKSCSSATCRTEQGRVPPWCSNSFRCQRAKANTAVGGVRVSRWLGKRLAADMMHDQLGQDSCSSGYAAFRD